MKDISHLIHCLTRSDTQEIEKLYQTNFHQVKRFVLQNKGQTADAEDIFQKALLQITVRYKKKPFEITSSFDAYLFTVCKNLWRRELNKSKYRVTTEKEMTQVDDNRDIALSLLEQKRWELFNDNLNKLSDNCKTILRLFFNRIPYADIVRSLNYNSEVVARQRVFKCKSKLIALVQKDRRFNELKQL